MPIINYYADVFADSSPTADPIDYEKYGTSHYPKNFRDKPVIDVGAIDFETEIVKDAAHIFKDRITAHGEFVPEPDRYHVFASLGCPQAHQVLIALKLKGLDDVIRHSIVDPLRDGRGWAFRPAPGATPDTSGEGFRFLYEAYDKSVAGGEYVGALEVPVLWDKKTRRIVSNEYANIILDVNSQFNAWAKNPDLDLYPRALQAELAPLQFRILTEINYAVYMAGFAQTQAEYEKIADTIWAALDFFERRLSDGRAYIFGGEITVADPQLWVTLLRFDLVYTHLFTLNLKTIRNDYPRLWAYTKRLYRLAAFRSTTDLYHISGGYFGQMHELNPSGVIPQLPDIARYLS
jgi:putative glutathione S-transferase